MKGERELDVGNKDRRIYIKFERGRQTQFDKFREWKKII